MRKAPVMILTVMLVACAAQGSLQTKDITLHSPKGKTIPVHVEIADTEKAQEQGLMSRTELANDHGMLFVFDHEQKLQFWMKNTLIPLDILFFAADGKFVSSASMLPCKKKDCDIYPSIGVAKFALELPAGFIAKQKIDASWMFKENTVQ